MKLVIKDNKVLATHDNNQEIESLYEGCQCVIDDNWSGEIGDEYEITTEQLAKAQAMKHITKRQLWEWLRINKQLLDADTEILTVISNLPATTLEEQNIKASAKNNYAGTNDFYYGNAFVQVIGTALGLTTDELKQCFDEAKAL